MWKKTEYGNPSRKVVQPDETPKDSGENLPHKQVKHAEELANPERKEPNKELDKDIQGKLRSCSVSLLRPPSRLSITPSSPNQTPVSTNGNNRAVSPTPNQSLRLLERPLVRHLNKGTPYNEEQLKSYVILAIVQGEITYRSINDEVEKTPILGKMILKGFKDGSPMSNKKKAKLGKLEDRLKEMSKQTFVKEAAREREEGRKKAD